MRVVIIIGLLLSSQIIPLPASCSGFVPGPVWALSDRFIPHVPSWRLFKGRAYMPHLPALAVPGREGAGKAVEKRGMSHFGVSGWLCRSPRDLREEDSSPFDLTMTLHCLRGLRHAGSSVLIRCASNLLAHCPRGTPWVSDTAVALLLLVNPVKRGKYSAQGGREGGREGGLRGN